MEAECRKALDNRIMSLETQLTALLQRLQTQNPLHKLKQGFSITKHNDTVLKNCANISQDDTLITQLHSGKIESKVTRVEHEH